MKPKLSTKTGLAMTGLLIALSLILTACQPSAGGQNPTGAATASGDQTVQVVNIPEVGRILATPEGLTLYTNTAATAADPLCVEKACTDFWPPFIVEGEISASAELLASLGTTTRPDGSKQLTFNQQPLYTFVQDTKPGDANGEGFADLGGTWHVAALGGASSGSSPTSGGGYGNY